MKKKTVAIEASGSLTLGMGHIMRTLVIAEKLKNIFNVYYICKNEKEYQTGAKALKKRGYPVRYINDKNSADILILDSYDVDENTLKVLRKSYNILVYVDDLNSLSFYDCDIIINKNLGAEKLTYNAPKNCRILKGPRYSLLREEFQNSSYIEINETIKSIFVTMGGTDPKNTSIKILDILKDTPYTFNIAVSDGFSDNTKKELKNLSDKNSNIILYNNPKMAQIMSKCDMAITACGGTTHEIASIGIPQIAISVAENQNAPLSFGEENGLFIYAGKEENLDKKKFLNLFTSLAKDFERRKRLSESEKKTINKNGIDLIEKEILSLIRH